MTPKPQKKPEIPPDLPIIQKTYDLIRWYIPILEKLPKTHKYTLGNRIIGQLYDFLEALIRAQFSKQKLAILEELNPDLNILRYQTRLLFDFRLLSIQHYEHAAHCLNDIGKDLGGWLKQQQQSQKPTPQSPTTSHETPR